MAEKRPNHKLKADFDLPNNINQLFFKKILASNHRNFEKESFSLSSKNKISITPTVLAKFKMPIRKKILILILCVHLLICYTLKLFSLTNFKKHQNLTLIYSLTKDQIYHKAKLSSLYEFMSSDRFGINKTNEIWVENKSINLPLKHKNLYVVFDIALSIYSRQFNFSKRAKILMLIYVNLYKFLRYISKNDSTFLVAKEYIFDNAVLNNINPRKIEKIITTQSHLMFQPLIFEMNILKKKRFMLWYSSNSLPLEYKNSKASRYEIPKTIYQYMKIDQHWVWNREHSDYLRQTMKVQTCIKGPMLFYAPTALTPDTQKIDVLIFDVTPTTRSYINQNSIYSAVELKRFLTEIITTCAFLEEKYKIRLRIFLKPKRRYYASHDYSYVNFLKYLESRGRLNIIRSNENLYNLVKVSKIVVGYPCVSPVIIGKEEGVPSFFYSSSKLLKQKQRNYASFFIQNSKELQLELERVLVSYK